MPPGVTRSYPELADRLLGFRCQAVRVRGGAAGGLRISKMQKDFQKTSNKSQKRHRYTPAAIFLQGPNLLRFVVGIHGMVLSALRDPSLLA